MLSQWIYETFKYLTDVPVNIWFWLLLIVPATLVFSASPDRALWLRLGRLVLAIGLAYAFLNLSIGTTHSLAWKEYTTCQNQFSDGDIQQHDECVPFLEPINDTNAAFAYLFGYILAAGCIGFWELLWRVYHKEKIRALGRDFKGRWFSNIVIASFVPWAIYILYSFGFVAFLLIVKHLSP